MRLIYADELAEELSKRVWYEREDEKQAVRIVKEFPTVDAVPVVRCKDCKWFQTNRIPNDYLLKGVPEYECRHWCGETDPTDYCSYGKRKGGDE